MTTTLELAILSDEISLNLEESFRLGKELGFRKYEIRCLDNYEHRIPNFLPGRIERLEELVNSGSIEITAITPGTFKTNPGDTDRIQFELEDILPRSCELAQRFKCPRLITFGFMREPGFEPEFVVDRLKQAAAITRQFGLDLAVENEPGMYCDTGVNTAAMVKAINRDHVGINWDPANALVSGEAAYPIGYQAVLPYLQNVHIKDAIPIPPDKWENRLIGDGGVNWLGQIRTLLKDRPVSHLTLETHVFPLIESTQENLRRLTLLFDQARQLGNFQA